MKKILISICSIASVSLPVLALAQQLTYFNTLTTSSTSLLKKILIFLIALAVVWFIWNVIRYTMSSDEEKKGAAKDQMIWGIIAIAVIVSVWGLVAILTKAFGTSGKGASTFSTEINNMIPQ